MKSNHSLLAAAAGLLAVSACPLFAQYSITVLHNNDGESELFGSDGIGGVAEFKTQLDATRDFYESQNHGVLAIYAGDTFLAGPEFQASLDNNTYYDALAISRIGYDASIIGNHEFDFGPDVLASFIEDAQTTHSTTYLSANLDFSGNTALNNLVSSGAIAASTTVTVATADGNKVIGIIGATTENLPFISTPGEVTVNDVVAAVNSEVTSLVSSGVDHIILGSHLQGIDEDIALIPSLSSEIDLIIAGGGDELLASTDAASPQSVYGGAAPESIADTGLAPGDSAEAAYPNTETTIPIVTTKDQYTYLGRVTLDFDSEGNFIGVEASSNPELNSGFSADSSVTSDIAPVQTFVDNLEGTAIGTSSVQLLHGGSDTIRSQETNLGNLVADAYLEAARLDDESDDNFALTADRSVALVNGGGIRDDIDVSDGEAINRLDTFNVSPFGNFVAVVQDMTVADLVLLLENTYSRTVDNDSSFADIDPVRQGSGTGRYAQISGLEVVYNINAQAMELDGDGEIVTTGERIRSVTLDDGTPLVEDGALVTANQDLLIDVVMPAFTARGGDQYITNYLSQDYGFVSTTTTDQQALQQYIESFGDADLADNGYGDVNGTGRITTIGGDFISGSDVFGDTSDGSGAFRLSPWLGSYFADRYPWVYHPLLQWFWVANAETASGENGLWLYSVRLESWLYTSDSLFPQVYSPDAGWLFIDLIGSTQSNLYYYNYSSQTWTINGSQSRR